MQLTKASEADTAQPQVIIYPKPMRDFTEDNWYPLQLLKLALRESNVAHRLQPSDDVLVQSRALKLLEENQNITLAWSMTSAEREDNLLPVRIPIYKGLYGWRLLLVKPGSALLQNPVSSVAELKKYILVQGHDWPDNVLLRSNGLRLDTATHIELLFSMLQKGRADAFPRSVLEIWSEMDARPNQFAVAPGVALYYPTAVYFFFNKQNAALAQLVEQGLNRAIANGKFDQLFYQHHRDAIARSALSQRTILRLHNAALPENTPVQRKELWFNVSPQSN
ncbi:ABC transporter substrate-binding protein [Rheinheimera sp.]|uniref:substrate-binding periplasmic protein n=1 Tax=Rheinheimera sp. TaxID=1869214 RepID=UPI0027356EA8|nr:transporter substrate-binding domain-containing protein [Rheinheimera sp.]MDP2716197.1 transporter substrate-binding domain-containing protein [Rheinheimera sp.]